MKILVIGDPHGKLPKNLSRIKGIDLILIPGDIGKADMIRKFAFDEELQKKAQDLKKSWKLLITKKIIKKTFLEIINSSRKVMKQLSKKASIYWIHGNVETDLDKEIRKLKLGIPFIKDITKIKNVHLINNRVVKYKGVKIAGFKFYRGLNWFDRLKLRFNGVSKEELMEFKKEEENARKFFNKIGHVDILLTHNPPYKILDKVDNPEAPKEYQGINAGSKLILKYCRKYKPKYILFGHIHEAKGELKKGETTYINLGSDGDYKIINI